MENQKSALGLDGNITALLCYLIGIVGLILVFIEKDNKFVRFHALQSVLWSVFVSVAFFALIIIGMVVIGGISYASSGLGGILWILFMLLLVGLGFAAFGGAIYAAIKGFGGDKFKLPVVGNMAEKWV